MGQVLHGSATTTEAVRRAIQHSQESLRSLAKRYGINQKTVAKWKKRTSVADLPNRSEGAEVDGAVGRGRGGSSLPSAGTPSAARRLPLRASGDDPAPDAIVPASLPAAPRDLPLARGRRRQACKEEVQDLSDRLSSISTSPRCRRRRASSISSSPSTAPRSSPSSSCIDKATTVTARAFLDALVDAVPYKVAHRPDRQRHPVRGPAEEPVRSNSPMARASIRPRLSRPTASSIG